MSHKWKQASDGQPIDDLERLPNALECTDEPSAQERLDSDFDTLWRRYEELDDDEQERLAGETAVILAVPGKAMSKGRDRFPKWARMLYLLASLSAVLTAMPASASTKGKIRLWLGASVGVLVTVMLVNVCIGGLTTASMHDDDQPTQRIAGGQQVRTALAGGIPLANLPGYEGSMTVGPGVIGDRTYPQSLSAGLDGCVSWAEFVVGGDRGQQRWLSTTVGVRGGSRSDDGNAGAGGSVVAFRVLADGKLVGEKRLGSNQRGELIYNVAGGRRLRLESAVVGGTTCSATSVAVWGRPYLSTAEPRSGEQDPASRGFPRSDLLAARLRGHASVDR